LRDLRNLDEGKQNGEWVVEGGYILGEGTVEVEIFADSFEDG